MRQGPHHEALKSITTGREPVKSSLKFSFVMIVAINTDIWFMIWDKDSANRAQKQQIYLIVYAEVPPVLSKVVQTFVVKQRASLKTCYKTCFFGRFTCMVASEPLPLQRVFHSIRF